MATNGACCPLKLNASLHCLAASKRNIREVFYSTVNLFLKYLHRMDKCV